MKRLVGRLVAAAALYSVFVAGNAALAAEATDRFTRTLPLGGRAIRLDATIAEVTILGSNRPDVDVEIIRHAPATADLARFPALVEESADTIRIAAAQAGDARDASLRSEIVVRAPAAAVFGAVKVFEGRVRLSGLTAACDVDIRRGPIEAAATVGRIRLETGIGNIDVKDAALASGGMLRLRAFNGSVRVRFARRPENARILALTFNGTVTSDVPLTMKDQFGPRFGEATLGSGDPVMSIDVVTGDIAISVAR